MSGMLGQAPANVPALVTQAEVSVSEELNKRFYIKAWNKGVNLVVEPTSVLDIGSPSPSSTLSSSVAAASSESGGAVAVSGRVSEGTSSQGQLAVDCASLSEGGNEALGTGKDEGAEDGMVGTWEAKLDSMHRGWEGGNVAAAQDGVCKKYVVDIGPALSCAMNKEAALLPCGNVGATVNSGLVQQVLTMSQKQHLGGMENLQHKAEKMVAKREVAGDGSLEACVMSCRKRDREDSLGEVVQRVFVCGQKILEGAREWQSDWNEFEDSASVVEEKVHEIEDLDHIFSGSPASDVDFWMGENLPLVQQLVQNSGAHVSLGIPSQSASKVQLDLFEGVQAELLCRGGGSSGSSVASSARPSNISPSMPQVFPSSVLTAPQNQPFSSAPGSSTLVLPFQRQYWPTFGDSPAQPSFAAFLQPRPVPAYTSPLLNATFAPAPPTFSSHPQQLQGHPFPLSATCVMQAAPPQANNIFSFSRAEYPAADSKPWQRRVLAGGAIARPKTMMSGGPKWQLKEEPGWPPVGGGHSRLSPHLSSPEDQHAPRQQAIVAEEKVGRRVRLDELLLAEQLLCAATEAAQLGDFNLAQAILARLNQQSSLSRGGEQQQHPARRAVVFFVEALSKWVVAAASSSTLCTPHQPLPSNSPLDLINKISAYKKFCEVSPISQFAHFTANQAILDAVDGEDSVHLVDFELGFGGQWASLMQEMSQRGGGPRELKITTMGADTLEMRLAKENLLQFAKEVGMKLEVNVVAAQNLEGLIKAAVIASKSCVKEEVVAVNFGFGMSSTLMSEFSSSTVEEVMAFLEMVKELRPKVVAMVENELGMVEAGPLLGTLYMEGLQFYACVFESLEASAKLSAEVVRNIERLVFGPKIGELVNARRSQQQKDMLSTSSSRVPWRILLQKVGFTAFPFSSAAESQASWLVKNPLNVGFTFLKQHTTLLLGWYNKTLVSASAWV